MQKRFLRNRYFIRQPTKAQYNSLTWLFARLLETSGIARQS